MTYLNKKKEEIKTSIKYNKKIKVKLKKNKSKSIQKKLNLK